MAVTLLTDFTGGSIGANPSIVTEPWAASVGGTAANMAYVTGLPGVTGQAVEVTLARDFVWNVTGSHWRLGMWVKRVSGTQSAGLATMLLRSGATARGDVFLRNQNGGQLALRAGVAGTVYQGQSATTIANGDTWWVELECNGTTLTLYLWHPANATNTPDETFSGTAAGTVTDVRLFNPTGTTGMTMQYAGVYRSDGEQIRSISAGTIQGRLLDIEARVPSGSLNGRLFDLEATVPSATLHGRLFDVEGTVPAAFIVTLSDPGILEPGIPVEITATATGGTPSGYTWVCSGATFEADGDSAMVTPLPTWAGDAITIACVVSGSGAANGTGVRTISVYPHMEWAAVNGAWRPIVPELLTI